MPTFSRCFLALTTLLTCLPGLVAAEPSVATSDTAPYTADWESLSKHNQGPEWFADAKLGIYFHWGVYSVPAYFSEWYPFFMFREGTDVQKHHLAKYGPLKEFGYHDFVPEFKAEKFDAAEWAELFKRSGAKFAGPVAQHHDGYAMWDSAVNPWNSADTGPKRDITGEIAKEIRNRGMKLIATFHHARNLQRNADRPKDWEGWNSHFAYHPDYPTSTTDPKLAKLYGNLPADEFHEYWFAQLKEVIDQYDPDILWFDVWLRLIPEDLRQEFAAYYLNEAQKKGQEVIIAYKQADMPSSVGVLDIEQGGKKDISESVWLTDITLSNRSWSYVEGQTYKKADLLVRNMIDVWSKNGVVLLNVSPKADGTIPQAQRDVLKQLGDWLRVYGEAVYGTRPYDFYGTGVAKAADGDHGGQSATVKYSASDIRLTQSKDGKALYLFFLGKPQAGETIQIEKLGVHFFPPHSPIKRITELASGTGAKWKFDTQYFYLTIPDAPMDEIATVFKFELE